MSTREQQTQETLSRRRRDALVLLLAWAAGGVDAIGFLGLNHVFTANMTGNTVLLGLALGEGRGLAAWSNVIALVGFGLGVALGALIVAGGVKPGEWDRRITSAIFWEAMMLAAFTLLWHLTPGGALRSSLALYLLIALSALAMGIQSAAVRRLNLPGVSTTYVTGTITTLIASATGRLRGAAPKPTPPQPAGEPVAATVPPAGHARLQAGVLILYGLSALVSGLIQTRVPWLVAVPPLVAVGVVLLLVSFHHREHESRSEARS
ncbi:MAG TPA: YoaK family protein [Candidatus Acidoferrales bacterium]|nr:YoaK family protein [Candidatus Acidoferrales bacterium]